MNSNPIALSTEIINKDLRLDEQDEISIAQNSLELLKESLKKILSYLADNDPNRLLQAMYRIDIKEDDFLKALGRKDIDKMADLVIERVLQKVKTRQEYS